MKKLFVLLAAVAFVVAFTAPTFASEWSFYGSARMHMFWEDRDLGDGLVGGDDTDFDLDHKLQGNARIGANVKVTDNLVGRFEYGSGPNLRILWGEYDFGGFKLGVGQHYTPLNFLYSNQAWDGDYGLLFSGGVYNGRRGMVRGKFGGLEVAAVATPTLTLDGYAVDDTDIVIPNLQAKYSFKIAGLSLDLAGGYQTYKVVDNADNDEDVNSYIVAIGGRYNMGPFLIGANYWMGQNVGNMGMTNDSFSEASWDGTDVLDNDGWGWILYGSFTLSDMLAFEAGYSMNNFDLDDAAKDDDESMWYIQANIAFAKGVFIVPEIGQANYGDAPDGSDEGSLTYYGLKWQINF